jgi:hypothetical protein
MVRTLTSRGTLAALAAGALALVAALLMVGSALAAATVSLSASPDPVAPGGEVVVSLDLSGDTVAGMEATVAYDETVLTATACTPSTLCNLTFGVGQVGLAPFDTGGLASGDATVTFSVDDAAEGDTDVDLTVTCADALGAALSCTGTGTTITVAEPATASPTPVPATATPSPTPKTLPQTGGTPGDNGSSIVWLLAVSGLAIVAGGAWAVARARREI